MRMRIRLPRQLSFCMKILVVAVALQVIWSACRLPSGITDGMRPSILERRHGTLYNPKPQFVVMDLNGNATILDGVDLPLIHDDFIDDREPWINRDDDAEEEECTLMYDWQTKPYSTCNTMHESSFSYLDDGSDAFLMVASGAHRIVSRLDESAETRWALKTPHVKSPLGSSTLFNGGIDATISEKLTSSQNVASIFGFCGASSLYEWSDEGALVDTYVGLNRGERLHAALDAARGLADFHKLGGGARSPFLHNDLGSDQYVKLHGRYQLNDFNCARILKWNKKKNEICMWTKNPHPDRNRAPEEQEGSTTNVDGYAVLDENTDTYVLGNIFYQLLMNKRKYDDMKTRNAAELILAGDVPNLPGAFETSTDVVVVALRTAMRMCLVLDPGKRAKSSEVAAYLEEEVKKLDQESSDQLNRPWEVPNEAPYNPKPQSVSMGLDGDVAIVDAVDMPLINDDFREDSEPWMNRDDNDEEEEECTMMYDWQTKPHPTCNTMHESSFSYLDDNDVFHMVASGVNRVVYRLDESDETRWALKTRHVKSSFGSSAILNEVIDSAISDKLSSSQNVASIFGFCGAASLYEWADEGTLEDNYMDLNRGERLHAALDAARGLADFHNLGGGTRSPFVHNDLATRQYVKLHGRYQLNDFNCARILKWNKKKNELCKWMKNPHPGRNRAPEEQEGAKTHVDGYAVLDENTDTYVLGNIFYLLLMNKGKYDDMKTSDAAKLIVAGDVPKLPESFEASNDIVVAALRTAMRMCIVLNPENRPRSSEVAEYLEKQVKKLEQESSEQLNRPWKVPNDENTE